MRVEKELQLSSCFPVSLVDHRTDDIATYAGRVAHGSYPFARTGVRRRRKDLGEWLTALGDEYGAPRSADAVQHRKASGLER